MKADLDAALARYKLATPGPWVLGVDNGEQTISHAGYSPHMRADDVDDAAFAVHAHADMPAMIAELRALRAVAEAAARVHHVAGDVSGQKQLSAALAAWEAA